MRLIDADALMTEIKSSFCKACIKYCRSCDIDDFINYIDDAPTIDAVPVVHAYWHNHSRFIATDEFGEEIVFVEQQCSNCNLWNIRMDRHIERKYCPHCGAKVDGDSSD